VPSSLECSFRQPFRSFDGAFFWYGGLTPVPPDNRKVGHFGLIRGDVFFSVCGETSQSLWQLYDYPADCFEFHRNPPAWLEPEAPLLSFFPNLFGVRCYVDFVPGKIFPFFSGPVRFTVSGSGSLSFGSLWQVTDFPLFCGLFDCISQRVKNGLVTIRHLSCQLVPSNPFSSFSGLVPHLSPPSPKPFLGDQCRFRSLFLNCTDCHVHLPKGPFLLNLGSFFFVPEFFFYIRGGCFPPP